MRVLALFSAIFMAAMSRSSFRVFARINWLHFRTWMASVECLGRDLGDQLEPGGLASRRWLSWIPW